MAEDLVVVQQFIATYLLIVGISFTYRENHLCSLVKVFDIKGNYGNFQMHFAL